ncbi:hypothetical protein ES705_02885 [subsurface metagenome]
MAGTPVFALLYGKSPDYDDYLAIFDSDGNMIKEIQIDYGFGTYDQLCLDPQGNVYDATGGEKIRKYDKDLNLLLTQDREDPTYWIICMNMGPDGYLYTLTYDADWMRLQKRRISDLTIVDTCILDSYYDGLCITADGYLFTICDWGTNDDNICKIRFSDGTIVAKKYLEDIEHCVAGIGVVGNNVYSAGGGIVEIDGIRADGQYIDINLAGNFYRWRDGRRSFNYRVTAIGGTHMITAGWNDDNDSILRKYDDDRNVIWEIVFDNGAGNPWGIGAYNFEPSETAKTLTGTLTMSGGLTKKLKLLLIIRKIKMIFRGDRSEYDIELEK